MLSESALIQGVKKRNRQALEELHDRFAPVLLGLSIRYCGNRADAEDVLHDSLIKILSGIDKFIERPNNSFEGWMKRITVNTALNFIRDRSRHQKWIEPDATASEVEEEETEESLITVAAAIGKEKLMQMICELPAGYRMVFNMYVFEDFSHKEIAESLNCSESTSKTQLFKARSILRKKVSEVLNKQIITQ